MNSFDVEITETYTDELEQDFEDEVVEGDDGEAVEPVDDEVTQEDLDNVEPYLESHAGGVEILQIYLDEIKRYPLLKPEEERMYGKMLAEGTDAEKEEARSQLIKRNLRFVVAKAIKYLNKGVEFEDLIQEGNIGLIRAVDRFDYTKGTRLTTYAGHWIRQALELAASDISKTSSTPRKTISRFKAGVRKAHENNPDLQGCYPTAGMIAKEMGTSDKNVESIFRSIQEPFQLDAPVKDGEDTKYYEIIEDPNAQDPMDDLIRMDKRKVLDECLAQLTRKERIVVKLMSGYSDGIEHSADEIGKEFNVTRERIRQIAESACAKIRAVMPESIKTEYEYT